MKNQKTWLYVVLGIFTFLAPIVFVVSYRDYNLVNNEINSFDDNRLNSINNEIKTIFINGVQLNLEVANDDIDRATGLMNRTTLNKNSGMLFIFEKPRILNFWMKNTFIPLDIIFIDDNYIVVALYKNTLPNQTSMLYSSITPARYVIELNAGSIDQINLSIGDFVFL